MYWGNLFNYLRLLGLIWHVGPQGWIMSDLFTCLTYVQNLHTIASKETCFNMFFLVDDLCALKNNLDTILDGCKMCFSFDVGLIVKEE